MVQPEGQNESRPRHMAISRSWPFFTLPSFYRVGYAGLLDFPKKDACLLTALYCIISLEDLIGQAAAGYDGKIVSVSIVYQVLRSPHSLVLDASQLSGHDISCS